MMSHMTHAGVYLTYSLLPLALLLLRLCYGNVRRRAGRTVRGRASFHEIESWREVEAPSPVDTVYFGGGTPSLLAPAQIKNILDGSTVAL